MRFSIAASIDRFGTRLGAVDALALAAEQIGYSAIWLLQSSAADGAPSWRVDPWPLAGRIVSTTERVGVVVAAGDVDDAASDALLTMWALAGTRCRVAVPVAGDDDAAAVERLVSRVASGRGVADAKPNVLVSGDSAAARIAAASCADGWVTSRDADDDTSTSATSWGLVLDRADAAGRRDALSWFVRLRLSGPRAASAATEPEEVVAVMRELRDAGVHEVVLDVDDSVGLDRMLATYASLYERIT